MQIDQNATQTLCYQPELMAQVQPEFFSGEYWQQQGAIIGSSVGRGVTWFFRHAGREYVLRHYRRGGLIGKVNDDRYLFTGLTHTRPYREGVLLNTMTELGLPVPRVAAVRVVRGGPLGLWYQGDLIIEKIPQARDLVAILQTRSLGEAEWHRIGQMIRRFHDAGIWHADLNSHNILLDQQGTCWLIDFDRGEQRQPAQAWQQANLARLQRSLRKEQGKLATFHWQETDWPALLAGYAVSQEAC